MGLQPRGQDESLLRTHATRTLQAAKTIRGRKRVPAGGAQKKGDQREGPTRREDAKSRAALAYFPFHALAVERAQESKCRSCAVSYTT